VDALIAAQNKISSGEYKQEVPFPDKGSDEEKNAWRKEHGLPESPEKYDLTFEDGLTIADQDKPMIDDFLKAAHGMNMPPQHVKQAVRWYYDVEQRMAAEQNESDTQAKKDFEDAMHAEWGNEYRGNMNRIIGLLDMGPEGLKDRILNGRLSDGTPIGSDQAALKWLVQLANDVNPVTTLTGGGMGPDRIEDRISEIERWMSAPKGTPDSARYWKDEKVQGEYRKLLEAREKMKTRKSA
jgi:hypothetical protein